MANAEDPAVMAAADREAGHHNTGGVAVVLEQVLAAKGHPVRTLRPCVRRLQERNNGERSWTRGTVGRAMVAGITTLVAIPSGAT